MDYENETTFVADMFSQKGEEYAVVCFALQFVEPLGAGAGLNDVI
jgi:hypothetical protein